MARLVYASGAIGIRKVSSAVQAPEQVSHASLGIDSAGTDFTSEFRPTARPEMTASPNYCAKSRPRAFPEREEHSGPDFVQHFGCSRQQRSKLALFTR